MNIHIYHKYMTKRVRLVGKGKSEVIVLMCLLKFAYKAFLIHSIFFHFNIVFIECLLYVKYCEDFQGTKGQTVFSF